MPKMPLVVTAPITALIARARAELLRNGQKIYRTPARVRYMSLVVVERALRQVLRLTSCFSPWRAREATGAEIPEKWGKNAKFPSPVRLPENGENCPPKVVKLLRKYNFCNFSVIFPIFGGRTGEGNFAFFPHFSGISAPVASPSKGKNYS